MRILVAAVLLVATLLAGCAGDETDIGKGPVCTGVLYDNCNSEHDCMSNDCRTYAIEGFNVCTQTCDTANPCPDLDGQPVACEGNLCKPAASRMCRVLP